MKYILTLFTVALVTLSVNAQTLNEFLETTDGFLKANVKNGLVDYAAITKNPSELNKALEIAKSITVNKTDKNNYQAFWINAYNLSVIKGLINEMPIKSPLDKKGFFKTVTYELAGKKLTLNAIENDILRAQFKDARFHFVLVCGAIGCPPLISEAYKPGTLDSQLEMQTKKAINGTFLKVKKNKVQASEIMNWYKTDFTMNGETEIDFINRYRTEKLSSKSKLSYFTYNWTINKQ